MNRFLTVVLAYYILAMPLAHAHGTHNDAPWDACKDQKRDAFCSFTDGHGSLFKGSCQLFSDALMCVRNQPIVLQVDDQSTLKTTPNFAK